MNELQDLIQDIINEIRPQGNTRERVGKALALLKDLKLDKGTYTGTAQELKTQIDHILTILNSPDTTLDDLNEIVAFIKQNKEDLQTLSVPNIVGLQDALNEKASVNHTHSYNDLTDKPTLFSGNYNDLTNKPDFAVRQDLTMMFAVHTQGVIVNESNFVIQPEHIDRTLFVKRSCTLNINEIADGIASVSVKKCYAGSSPINFTFSGQMIKNGGDSLNGLEGSNAVISIVDNTCYIDICNYE